MRYHTTSRLSEHILETPEGFLLCRDVPIARTGAMEYLPDEVPVASGGRNVVLVHRLEQDLFSPETMASFEGKSVTLDHPDDEETDGFVTPDNWRGLSRGHAQNVRRGAGEAADLLLADLLVMDAEAIAAVRGGLREVSCGYDADYEETAPGVGRQVNIIGNHIALVDRGRCGPRCKIKDKKPETFMKNKNNWFDRLFGNPKVQKALDEAAAELETKDSDTPPAKDNGAPPVNDQEQSQPATDNDAKLEEILLLLRTLVEALPAKAADNSDPAQDSQQEPAGDSAPEQAAAASEGAPAKTGDSKRRSMRAADAETVRRAKILSPHIAARVGDSHCAVVKHSLGSAMKDAALAPAISSVLRGQTLDSADCLTLDAAFLTASELAKAKNNVRTADSLTKSTVKDWGGAVSPADINEANRKFYDRKGGE